MRLVVSATFDEEKRKKKEEKHEGGGTPRERGDVNFLKMHPDHVVATTWKMLFITGTRRAIGVATEKTRILISRDTFSNIRGRSGTDVRE